MTVLNGQVTYKGLIHRVRVDVLKEARKFKEPDDDIQAKFYMYLPHSRELVVAPIPHGLFDPETRHSIPRVIATVAQKGQASLVATVWTTYELSYSDLTSEEAQQYADEFAKDSPRYPDGLAPSDHPKRQEAVLAMVYDAEVQSAWWCPIRRNEKRPPVFGPWTARRKNETVVGHMIDPIVEALR